MPVQYASQRRYFRNQRAYYPYYRTQYNRNTDVISPFGFYFGVNAPFLGRTHVFFNSSPVVYIEIPQYDGNTYRGWNQDGDINYFQGGDISDQEPGLLNAIAELEEGYRGGNIDSMAALCDPNGQVSIFLQGEYSYSMSSSDYLDLTRDAFSSTQTIDFTFTTLHKRSDGVYAVAGRHRYRDQSSRERSVYVSYVFEDQGGNWTLTQVETTPDRIQSWN